MAIDTTKKIKQVTYNGVEIPLAGGGSSSGPGYKITFPATATNWNQVLFLQSSVQMGPSWMVRPIPSLQDKQLKE